MNTLINQDFYKKEHYRCAPPSLGGVAAPNPANRAVPDPSGLTYTPLRPNPRNSII
jgi:hypothetical protein